MNRSIRFIIYVLAIISWSGCDHDSESEPDYGSPYFSHKHVLPQTQSSENLAEYLSSEHMEYDLGGWFFFGSLEEDTLPDKPGVFFISMQRIAQEIYGTIYQTVPAIAAFNSPHSGKYVFGGVYTIDMEPYVQITSSPWQVKINSQEQKESLMTMRLISGMLGQPNAEYRLTSYVPDQMGDTLIAEIILRDRLGTVNQGYGTASFFPQYLTEAQQVEISLSYNSSVQQYLGNTGDPMAGQGSFYYSLPLMDVESFSIRRNNDIESQGTKGVMWMDHVVQSYSGEAADILIDKASWEFFSIMLPEESAAIMVIRIESGTGVLPVAKFFKNSTDRTRNSALNAVYSWDMDDITIEAGSGGNLWVSPETGLEYVQEYHILLESDDYSADLTIRMIRENQEIVVDLTEYGMEKTIKYEGLAWVTGTLEGKAVNGIAFVELQPFGYQ